MEHERRILAACAVSLFALVLWLVPAENREGQALRNPSRVARGTPAPFEAARLVAARRGGSDVTGAATDVSPEESTSTGDEAPERRNSVAVSGGLLGTSVRCIVIDATDTHSPNGAAPPLPEPGSVGDSAASRAADSAARWAVVCRSAAVAPRPAAGSALETRRRPKARRAPEVGATELGPLRRSNDGRDHSLVCDLVHGVLAQTLDFQRGLPPSIAPFGEWAGSRAEAPSLIHEVDVVHGAQLDPRGRWRTLHRVRAALEPGERVRCNCPSHRSGGTVASH